MLHVVCVRFMNGMKNIHIVVVVVSCDPHTKTSVVDDVIHGLFVMMCDPMMESMKEEEKGNLQICLSNIKHFNK